eukprot:c13602_g1_i1 orf=418-882(-)
MEYQKFTEDIVVKVPPKRLWLASVKDGHKSSVKSVPHKVAKAVDESGNFGELGSVRTMHFHKGVHPFDFLSGKVVEVDQEKLYLKLQVTDGNLEGTLSNSYIVTLHYLEGVVKCTVEWKGPPQSCFPQDVKEFLSYVIKNIDDHVLANEHEYKY